MSEGKLICTACGQEVDPEHVHLSEINDKHFRLDGQRLIMKGWVNGHLRETTIGVFIPEIKDHLAPAIVRALNRFDWLALEEDGELREDQVTM